MTNILLTGGAGYIASHTAVSLIEAGLQPILLDNFINSSPKVLDRLERLTGVRPILIEMDVLNTAGVTQVLRDHHIQAVVHFAALKAVGESVTMPLEYYHNNVVGLINVLQAMRAADVKHIVLSSSATVYGEHNVSPYKENSTLSATSPYGESKVMMEHIIRDVAKADLTLRYAMLRYFNPVGAHPSGLIGEHPRGIPNNLMPYIQQVAVGLRDKLSVFGNDYDTTDGTGERDYIHVMDLARGHVLAVQHLLSGKDSITTNLGTGQPVSVLHMVKAFEAVSGKAIPYQFAPRRAGDIACFYADPSLSQHILNFHTEFNIDDMCRDAWNWQRQNPNGYETEQPN
ncbi:UDP-glucose 4-epimerase GalE [Hydromonas duriensis]|uniref:UDP-glucose 4-epimerase n=1 Tax=Hydromonas duriensis TaxID=1527608 RepID=A0A4R6Y735_9BURK|nr:UDP-glucose 4-epimerase GalE [Hydromonas duriensis]TDR30807.1 UDP-galactose 4-epimerase [Hydromonas duriensis]